MYQLARHRAAIYTCWKCWHFFVCCCCFKMNPWAYRPTETLNPCNTYYQKALLTFFYSAISTIALSPNLNMKEFAKMMVEMQIGYSLLSHPHNTFWLEGVSIVIEIICTWLTIAFICMTKPPKKVLWLFWQWGILVIRECFMGFLWIQRHRSIIFGFFCARVQKVSDALWEFSFRMAKTCIENLWWICNFL